MIRTINDFHIDNFLSEYFSVITEDAGSILDLGCGMQPYRSTMNRIFLE